MSRGAAPQDKRRKLQARMRNILRLVALGLCALGAGVVYVHYAVNYSGKLALAQRASAADVVRGMDFGPVYLEQGVPGRYFITATLPEVDGDYWHTEFEVLDERLTPVFAQNELRIIGNYDFVPGEREHAAKRFTLDKGTGYYYFRYRAVNGVYDVNPAAPPVVEFAVRRGVIAGMALWLPATGCVILGVLCFMLAVALLRRLQRESTDRHEHGESLSAVRTSGGPYAALRR